MNIKKLLVAATALSPGLAFAAAPDTTAITTAITDGQTAAVAVAIAFGVAIWAVRALKLIRRG